MSDFLFEKINPGTPTLIRLFLVFTFALASAFAAAAAKGKADDVRLQVAEQWADKGEYDKAVQEYRLYLSEHPDSPEIYGKVGAIRLKQGNFKLASENFKIALAKNPDMPEVRENLATAYEKAGEKEKALDEWRRIGKTQDPALRRKASARIAEIENPSAATGNAKVTPAAVSQAPTPPANSAAHNAQSNPRPAQPNATHQTGAASSASSESAPRPRSASASEGAKSPAHAAPAKPAPEGYFSPAMDSGSSEGAKGIYAQKEFLDALRLYREKKPDSVLVALKKCIQKTPGHPGAYYLGGVLRYEKGDYAKAAYNFKRSFDYPDRGFNAYYYLGRIYQRQEKHPEAIESFEKYLQLTKSEQGRRQAESYLAQIRGPNDEKPTKPAAAGPVEDSANGKPAAVAEKPNAATEKPGAVKPASPSENTLVLGRDTPIFFIVPDSASQSGKKLIEAYGLCKREKFEKAVNTLKEAALNYGGSENADAAGLDMASVYLRLGLWDNALDRISDYLSRNPKDSAQYQDASNYLAALAYLGKKDGERAEKSLLKIKPGRPSGPSQEEVDYRLSQTGELLKDSKKWATYLEKAINSARDPHRKAALLQQLGFLHVKFGSADRAMEYFKKSMEDCRDTVLAAICAESHLRLADMEFKKKDWKAAMNHYRQFAAKYPEHKEAAWVHYQMANIYKATNNFESALNEYKKVIDNYPESYWSSQAKWKREDTIWQKEYEEVLD